MAAVNFMRSKGNPQTRTITTVQINEGYENVLKMSWSYPVS